MPGMKRDQERVRRKEGKEEEVSQHVARTFTKLRRMAENRLLKGDNNNV